MDIKDSVHWQFARKREAGSTHISNHCEEKKVRFWKNNVGCTAHLSFVSIRAKWEVIQNLHITLKLMHFLFCLYYIFFFISPKVRNSMEAWNDFRGSEWGKVWKRAIHQLGSKILQPVISHFSCTSGIVLWSPLRGIKPGLIIIIEMLIAEVQITTVSNHQEAHTHTHNNDRHWLKGRVQEPQCEKVEKVTLWLWISIKGESKQCQC